MLIVLLFLSRQKSKTFVELEMAGIMNYTGKNKKTSSLQTLCKIGTLLLWPFGHFGRKVDY